MKNPVLLLDADVLCHQMAYACTRKIDWDQDGNLDEQVNPEQMKVRIESFILQLVEDFRASDVVIALSHRGSNFRKELWAGYKATRLPKPTLWEAAREFIETGVMGYRVECWPRLEGDDVLGILHTGEFAGRSMIVSIDKDMRTVPGWLHLFNKPELGRIPISPEEAHRFHMVQTMAGDATDEYDGIPRIGMKTAEKLIDDPRLRTFFDGALWPIVLAFFQGAGLTEADALLNARLARILQAGEYDPKTSKVKLWQPPTR